MNDFKFKKKFGQNFIKDEQLLAQIVEKSGIMCDDVVIEIGAGQGSLTSELSKKAKQVISFEIDEELSDELQKKFDGTNVSVIFKDFLSVSDEEIDSLTKGKFSVVANLPYYITSPIITRLLKNDNLKSLTVMVQEEVADRIVAKPKTKNFGVLSVICQVYGSAQKLFRVGREMFYPVPKVDSAVVRIDKNCEGQNFDEFLEFVKRAFSMKRKKISTNLQTEKLSKERIEQALISNGFSPLARAEELSVGELKKLYSLLSAEN